MSILGSLPFFLGENSKISSPQHKFRRSSYDHKSSLESAKPTPRCVRNLSDLAQYDQSTDGFIYVSTHKDVSNLLRIGSAAASNRIASKKKPEKLKIQKKEVKSRISARRDLNEMKIPVLKTVKMQEKIRNELLYFIYRMKNNHFIMRCMRKNLREDEKKSNDSICESSNLFHRLVQKVLDSKTDHEPLRYKKNIETEKVVQKSSEAIEKAVRASSSAWMKKRGNFEENKDSNISRMIFMMLDPEDRGEIPENTLIKFLLEIGLSFHPARIREALRLILKKESSSFKVRIEDISLLCKGDHRCNLIIKYLNEEVTSERLNKPESTKNDSPIISISEQLQVLNTWWLTIDKKMINQVPVNTVAEFLSGKTIVGDSHEGRKLVKEVVNDAQNIEKDEFFALFAKSMIKWVLINVPNRFSQEEWKNNNYSPAFKITCLKRNLIMAGLKCNKPGFSQEEGSLVIGAIEKFRNYTGEKVQKIDFEQFSLTWSDMITDKKDRVPRAKVKITSVQKILDDDRPRTVPNLRIEAENSFFSEFQKFVAS